MSLDDSFRLDRGAARRADLVCPLISHAAPGRRAARELNPRFRHLLVSGLLACSLTAGAAAASAQTEQPSQSGRAGQSVLDKLGTFKDFDDLELEDLLHTTVAIAAGRTQTLEEAPSIVSVITDEQIRETGVRTLAEALQLAPGIVVLMDNFGRGRIAIRGVSSGLTSGSSENVLLLFNGHRLNDEISGGATIQNLDIPVDGVKKIEIIRGPGSALFGANAYLGVINIISYKAETFDGLRVAAGGGSFSTGEGNIVFGRSVGKLSISGFVQHTRTDGPRLLIPADVQTLTDAALRPLGLPAASLAPGYTVDDRKSTDANFTVAFEGLTLNGRVKDENAGGYVGVVDVLGTDNRQRANQVLFDANYKRRVGKNGDLSATFSYTRSALTLFVEGFPPQFTLVTPDGRASFFPTGLFTEEGTKSRRFGGEVVFNLRAFRGNTITTGLSLEGESTFDLTGRGNFNPITFAALPTLAPLPPLVLPDDRQILGVFVQDSWDPSPTVGITAGLRWDHYNDFGTALSPRAGIVWRLPRNLNLKMLYGHAFRAPSFTELFFNFPGFTGNPNLRAATINTLELALGYKRKDVRISGNVYGNFLRDLIQIERPFQPTELTRFVNNQAGINATGAELEIMRYFGPRNWLQFGYAYQHSEDRSTGLRVAEIPTHVGNIGGTAAIGRYVNVTPMVLFRGSIPREVLDPRPPLDHYTALNLTARLHNAEDSFGVAVTADNLFDTTRFDPSPINGLPGDYPLPGRRVLVRASWRVR
jgi:outer membrane receptor protein involved in Fe transport